MMKKKRLFYLLTAFFMFSTTANVYADDNILDAYTYNTSSCITGEETTCVKTDCYKGKTCPIGTIIKYKVNDIDTKYFYVLHDDGNTLTIQQRENTLDNIPWYLDDSAFVFPKNTSGPLNALPKLEEATSGWTNVNNQTYTLGNLGTPSSCKLDETSTLTCSENVYTLTRTAKARMINMSEAINVGCNFVGSCPIWMFNYLKDSTNYGGTNNTSASTGYWTAQADADVDYYAYNIYAGSYNKLATNNTTMGLRAVVVIDKSPADNSSTNSDTENNNSSNTNANNANNNKETVQVENTAKSISIFGFSLGIIVLIIGIGTIYKSIKAK